LAAPVAALALVASSPSRSMMGTVPPPCAVEACCGASYKTKGFLVFSGAIDWYSWTISSAVNGRGVRPDPNGS
jgi:hypothetical protein